MLLKNTLTASVVMLVTMVFLHYISEGEEIHPNKSFETFPTQLAEWKGEREFFSENIYDVLGVDDYFMCRYNDPKALWTHLYIGFYQSQQEGDLIHSPKNCMPGAGWNIIRTSLEELEFPGDHPDKIKAIKLIIQKGDQKKIMLYWFQSRGRIISSEYMQKIWLVIDSVTRHRTDGSFVRLISPIVNNNEEMTLQQLKKFARHLMPLLYEYIPS
ncbi:exosortase C-terminal domain/associated protein EpsI [Desulfonema magnum]|uniref:EpsI family protein n=1 Tax=Desulfonema magnum TaxID=45655 RepID=A0A975BHY0_9BACT|nr:exosortase C-terminal domain/associated protein EpsI [Desulfonema magnum]QTA85539.1 EpsI family protein [Desulfonema magnum]